MDTKTCTKCKLDKVSSEFNYGKICNPCRVTATLEWRAANPDKAKSHQSSYYERNKESINAKAKERREADPERYKRYDKDYREKNRDARNARQRASFKKGMLKRNYGLTLLEFESMRATQNNLCAICGLDKKLEVDHNHTTGKVRGLLCTLCNRALGFLQEDPRLFVNSIKYLETHNNAVGGIVQVSHTAN